MQVYGFCIHTLRLTVISVMIIGVMWFSYNDRAVLDGRFRHHLLLQGFTAPIMMKYLLSIFTADCLRHPIQMAGVETIWELHTLTVINSW